MGQKRQRVHLVQSVANAADVLYWFAANPDPARFSDVCRGVRLSKAATYRLLSTLESKGLLTRSSRGSAYCLGAGAATLGAALLFRHDLVGQSHDVMRRLWETTGESVNLNVRVDFQRVCVSQLESPQPLRYAVRLGKPLPIYCGAAGKVFLAMLDDEQIRSYLSITPLARVGPNTITEPDRLWQELIEIRRKGYATGVEETGSDVAGVAAPILDGRGQCVAGLSVYAPKTRMPPERLENIAQVVVKSAKDISARLSGEVLASAERAKEVERWHSREPQGNSKSGVCDDQNAWDRE